MLGVLWRVTLWEPIFGRRVEEAPGVHCEIIIAQVLCTLSAMADETVQLFVPGRSGQVTDVLLDSAGALAGIIFVLLVGKIGMVWAKKRHR